MSALLYRALQSAAVFFAHAEARWRPVEIAVVWTDDSEEPHCLPYGDGIDVDGHVARAQERGARVLSFDVVTVPAWRAERMLGLG